MANYYVSPNGDDLNPGTEALPFATAAMAQSVAEAGDLIYFRGGRYVFNDLSTDIGVLFNKSGSPGERIRYWAYPGETPVFDFYELVPQARIRGFAVRASWLHFKGLELTGVQQILTNVNESWAIRIESGASNNIFENLNLHHNEGPGLFIADGGNNLVLNVDSHHNYDPDRGGENADGFGCHTNDTGNVFRGNRAWYNSDDGFDFINSPAPCVLEYSMAFYNGFIPDTQIASGNGSGVKAGGFGLDASRFPSVIPRHIVRYNIAAANRASGFYANHHPGGIDWIHNTAYNNPRNFDMKADMGPAAHYLRNNLALAPGAILANATQSEIDDWGNSWNLNVDVNTSDFESMAISDALAPRRADGSLPAPVFLYPSENSVVIDSGVNVAQSSPGDTPDIGAYERGKSSTCWAQ
ncbi:Right handed beta helix region [Alteromonadaceae bacterium Bs31]|nr:Right handed beta helix region [Alteromonadaceae bacterium Bs31]